MIQLINSGSILNDGTGDSMRVGAGKINENFTELYASASLVGDTPTHIADSSIHFTQGEISITESQISDLQHYTDDDVKTKLNLDGVVSGSSQVVLQDTFGNLSGSRIVGDIQASSVEYVNVLNKPTLISSSLQVTITESQISDLSHTDISHLNTFSGSIQGEVNSLIAVTGSYITSLPYINVRDFGAVGDGITDDYTAINNAILSASSVSGGTIYFPIGNYLINSEITISGTTNLSFIGDNLNSKIIAKSYNGRHFLFTDCDSIVFKNIRLIGDTMDSINSVGGIKFQLFANTNTAYHIFENVVVEEITNSAIVMDTPILCNFKNVLTRLVVGHGWDLWNGGTSVTFETCFALTCTKAGYMLDTMTYCSLDGCAADVCGVGYNFRNSKAISLLGCGSEDSIYRNATYDGTGWKLFNSSIVTAISCYERASVIEFNIETGSRLDMINFKASGSAHMTVVEGLGGSVSGSAVASFNQLVTQTSHGLSVGNAIRHNGTSWVKAVASSVAGSGTIGVVNAVTNANTFIYQYGGLLTTGSFTNGTSYFLSPSVSGGIITEPSYIVGQVREFIGTGTPDGLLLELDLGDEITAAAEVILPNGVVSGSSQVSYTGITNVPAGIVSGSSQVVSILSSLNTYTGSNDTLNTAQNNRLTSLETATGSLATTYEQKASGTHTLISGSSQVSYVGLNSIPANIVSGSSQVIYTQLSSIPAGIVSGSTQITPLLPTGTVSGSTQVSFTTISNKPTLVSGSSQVIYTQLSSIPAGIVSGSSQITKSLQDITTVGGTTTDQIIITNNTASTTHTTGALFVSGGIGTSGNINAGGEITAYAASDKRLKNNITPITNPIEKILKLSGNTFDWNEELQDLHKGSDIGVIAQEVEKVFPSLVSERTNGYKGVKYEKLVPLLIEAIKELSNKVEILEKKLENK